MGRLLPWLKLACSALNLKIDEGFTVQFKDGKKITALARIFGTGQEEGMLIFEDYDCIKEHVNLITGSGFGYSVLEEPFEHEVFDLDQYKEMFLDWGFELKTAK
jgi:hypothetical protein